jgi:hypothetical protein
MEGISVKMRLCLILLGILSTLGCTRTARFYPVQGPLVSQTPLPVPTAKVSFGINPGNLSVVLTDGEVCKGHWVPVKRGEVPARTDSAPGSTAIAMQADWDAVYGAGFYTAHVLGSKYYARTTATGDRGTVLHVEMYRPENAEGNLIAAVKGVARDNRENVYKLVLQ